MTFQQYADLINKRFSLLINKGCIPFESSFTGNQLWDVYLQTFKPEDNPIFRDPNSSVHNCNTDKSFIRRYGNIVFVDPNDFSIQSMFGEIIKDENNPYYNSSLAMDSALVSYPIKDIFVETFDSLTSLPYERVTKNQSEYRLGFEKNSKVYSKEEVEKFGVVKENVSYTFYHFFVNLPKKYVDMSGKSIEAIQAIHRDNQKVFKRGLDEISLDTLKLVKDLIIQGSLLNGNTYLSKLEEFIKYKSQYDLISANIKEQWAWVVSNNNYIAKFRNELIGTLCIELTEGKDLNKACEDWNKRIDPANYMKATAPITKRQIEEARKFVEENGYSDSFNRRFATISDINISEILHTNSSDYEVKQASIFDKVQPSKSTQHKRSQFNNIEEVSVEKFMQDILPSCTSIEALFENKHRNNLVALTTSNNSSNIIKNIFKWNNNFSWSYIGNLAGKSLIKDAVKGRGGNIEGIVNIRLAFPNTTSDYDLHVYEPNQGHIYYENVRKRQNSSGMLDLDAQGVDGRQVPKKRVENIYYSDFNKMPNGNYTVLVNNYSKNDNNFGFTIEFEYNGEISVFKYDKLILDTKSIEVLKFKKTDNDIEIIPSLPISEDSSTSSEYWGIKTNDFHKVNLVCLSPNYWGENNIGNKHYFFMLDDCKSDGPIRSFHNENLNSDLLQHRKVMEVLGLTSMLEPSNKQLCGLGFNSTVKDELILRISGSFKRVIKIKF